MSKPERPELTYEIVDRTGALVSVIMGSQSDWSTMRRACEVLGQLEIPWERQIVSAHRTPDRMHDFAQKAHSRDVKIIIAGAGGAAHLPGMVAGLTLLPVLGVPIKSSTLSGVDSLYSIVQMPAGVPTATFSIGEAGATNAALFAARMLALNDTELFRRLAIYVQAMHDAVPERPSDPT